MMFGSTKAAARRTRRRSLRRMANTFAVVCALAGGSEVSRAQNLTRDMRGVLMPPVAMHSQIPTSRQP